jgi:anti-sigma factor RsiW
MTNQNKPGLLRRAKGAVLKHMHRMITCREFEDFVLRYLDGELSTRQRSVFELHMRLCRECREYLAAYQRTIEVGREAFESADEALPDDVPEDLIKAILEARKL